MSVENSNGILQTIGSWKETLYRQMQYFVLDVLCPIQYIFLNPREYIVLVWWVANWINTLLPHFVIWHMVGMTYGMLVMVAKEMPPFSGKEISTHNS